MCRLELENLISDWAMGIGIGLTAREMAKLVDMLYSEFEQALSDSRWVNNDPRDEDGY